MSASPRTTAFTRDGLSFDVIDNGPMHADTAPIVLLHGFPQRASSWAGVTDRLNDAGYRTLAPDQRGYSPGARPTSRRAYGIDDLTEDIVTLIDTVGGPVHLVGHDWGSIVAWALAARRPDLVCSLTAVSVPHPAAFVRALPHGQAQRSWYMALFQLPIVPELLARHAPWFIRRSLASMGMTTPELTRFDNEIIDDGAFAGGLNYYRAMPLWGRSASIGRVRVPTTYVWTSEDAALGRYGAMTTGEYVRAPYRFVVLPGSHWVPDQQPDALAEVIIDRTRSVEPPSSTTDSAVADDPTHVGAHRSTETPQ